MKGLFEKIKKAISMNKKQKEAMKETNKKQLKKTNIRVQELMVNNYGIEKVKDLSTAFTKNKKIYNKGFSDGEKSGKNALKFLNSDDVIAKYSKKAIIKANKIENVPGGINTLLSVAAAESNCGSIYRNNEGANPINNFYTGLFQLGSQEAKSVGYTHKDGSEKDVHGSSEKNIENNAIAGAKFIKRRNQKDAFNIYLAHQQGSTGRKNLIKNVKNNPNENIYPNEPKTLKSNLYGNFSSKFLGEEKKKSLTYSQWYYYWKGRIEGISSVMPNSL